MLHNVDICVLFFLFLASFVLSKLGIQLTLLSVKYQYVDDGETFKSAKLPRCLGWGSMQVQGGCQFSSARLTGYAASHYLAKVQLRAGKTFGGT